MNTLMVVAVGKALPATVSQPLTMLLGILLWCAGAYLVGRVMWIAGSFLWWGLIPDGEGPTSITLTIIGAIVVNSAGGIAAGLLL